MLMTQAAPSTTQLSACSFSVAYRNHYKFTGKERDSESGLDMFGARYYGGSLGRFMTPDWAAKPIAVPYAHYGNPQSLNLYSYVQNNPTTVGDPDGHCMRVSLLRRLLLFRLQRRLLQRLQLRHLHRHVRHLRIGLDPAAMTRWAALTKYLEAVTSRITILPAVGILAAFRN